jgi:hypothetical protein
MGIGSVKFPDQVGEPVRHPLAHNIVIHSAELMADSGLNLGIEAALLARLLYFFHELFHISPRVKPL